MYLDLLKQAGLSEKEAVVYEKILQTGPLTAGKLVKQVPFKRGDVYYLLSTLKQKGLLGEELKGGLLTYSLAPVEKLDELVRAEQEKQELTRKAIASALPNLRSLYNLSMKRPGVRFFEGNKGVLEALHDSLSSKTEILSIGDIDSILRYHPEVSKAYAKRRGQMNIVKRGLALDTPTARKYLSDHYKSITTTKLIKLPNDARFEALMQIYDGKVSYITFPENIAVIIEDRIIYKMHRLLFDYLWEATPGGVV